MEKTLRVLADENIPVLERLLPEHVSVIYRQGRSICAADLENIDALFVRSVTKVNERLLQGSSVQFVGSCTIGTDHVDVNYLRNQGIPFANAPGCNAQAVVDYVLTAMLDHESNVDEWKKRTVGIIGCGQVGSRLKKRLECLQINVRCYDPFMPSATDSFKSVLASDCISLHVPLTHEGEYPTLNLLSDGQLGQISEKALLINASRGGVINQKALKSLLMQRYQSVVLDVFDDEPTPDPALLPMLAQATPHIAGYSEQGKIRGTLQVVEAFCEVFGVQSVNQAILAETFEQMNAESGYCSVIEQAFPLSALSKTFRSTYLACKDNAQRATCFDHLRKNHPLRKEWAYIKLNQIPESELALLKALGFSDAT